MNRKQPVCKGINDRGQLIWDYEAMELWQILQLFYKHYEGDLGEQWMWLVLAQKGMDYVGESHGNR